MKKGFLALALLFLATACASDDLKSEYPEKIGINKYGSKEKKPERIFGSGGLTLGYSGGDSGINVNTYLWRASLDTLSFMPLVSADPFGGVIMTDWYSPEGIKTERFKLNVMILSSTLKADGLKVSAFSQIKNAKGEWEDRNVESDLPVKIENAILTRARELRLAD